MRKFYIALTALSLLALGAVACSEKEDTEAAVPEFEGVIETDAAVDLGLSVLWASCNVGAETPEASGNYYACFETEPVSDSTSSKNYILSEKIDPATAILGGSWKLPTKAEVTELSDSCAVVKAKYNGKVGYVITGKNGKSIFFPACGYKATGKIVASPTSTFWCDNGTETGGDVFSVQALNDTTCTVNVTKTAYNYLGLPIRPVKSIN